MKDNYFNNYLENNICKELSILDKNISNNDFYNEQKIEYYKIECLSDNFDIKDINNLPNLKLINIPFNYTFIFSGNDLFLKEDNKYIFQVFFANVSYWYIGRLFLYKYQLIFNEDNNLIGFYTGKKEKNIIKNTNFFQIVLFIIISLFCLFLLFIFYKKIKIMLLKNDKKKAKELEDDFSYKKSDIYEDKNNENLLFNTN